MKLSEAKLEQIYNVLLERFGEPIDKVEPTVGIRDEGSCEKSTYNDKTKQNRNWSDPTVVKEAHVCERCGNMSDDLGETCRECSAYISEARNRVSPEEVEQTWEDLYVNYGSVSIEDLASWLSADPNIVKQALPRYLVVDKRGNVVERGLSN